MFAKNRINSEKHLAMFEFPLAIFCGITYRKWPLSILCKPGVLEDGGGVHHDVLAAEHEAGLPGPRGGLGRCRVVHRVIGRLGRGGGGASLIFFIKRSTLKRVTIQQVLPIAINILKVF